MKTPKYYPPYFSLNQRPWPPQKFPKVRGHILGVPRMRLQYFSDLKGLGYFP